MDISLTFSGKFLPVPFARGYINALWLPSRTEIWKTYYRSAVARFVPTAEEDHWLHLLDPYLTETEEVTPLNYTVLRVLHANMLDDGRTEPRKMHQIATSALTTLIGGVASAGGGRWQAANLPYIGTHQVNVVEPLAGLVQSAKPGGSVALPWIYTGITDCSTC